MLLGGISDFCWEGYKATAAHRVSGAPIPATLPQCFPCDHRRLIWGMGFGWGLYHAPQGALRATFVGNQSWKNIGHFFPPVPLAPAWTPKIGLAGAG